MPAVAGPLVDRVLQRVRDVSGTGFGRDIAREAVSLAQRHINAKYDCLHSEVSFSTAASQVFYPFDAQLPDIVRVLFVLEGARRLDEVPYERLRAFGTGWHRAVGTRFEAWAPLGRKMFVVYPTKNAADSVSVVYTREPALLQTDSSPIEVPERYQPQLLDLAFILLSLKGRFFDQTVKQTEGFAARIQEERRVQG